MNVQRHRLGNGLRIAVAPISGLRSVATLLAVEAGQWFEPPGRPGIARLCAQAMLRGTTKRDAKSWADALDAIGAAARLDVGPHAATFSAQSLADDLGGLLTLIAEAVVTPAFVQKEVELVRQQTVAQLEEDSRNTRAVAERAWRELVYPKAHPFHARPIGDPAVVRAATAEDLRAHHQRAIQPDGAVLVVAGGVEARRVFDEAGRAFADWSARSPRETKSVPEVALSSAVRRIEIVPDKTQSDVVLGWPGLPRTDPRFVAARVTNMVFAADTFASRAGHVVRDELGLAYYVFSTIGTSRGQSPWTVRMGVNPINVERAISVTLDELRKIVAGKVAEDDLELAQDKLVGELDVARESPGGVASLMLEGEVFELGPDHVERYPRELRAVTLDQVIETARTFLPSERHALAIAGPPLPEAD
ncbi:MAG TPA: pitrilysin family protein [Candidatus Limnocylindria bacterium]|jgi:zinc protease|nr:pitrilysin family protein [Candidatus Limnocylindria bacterium]